MQLGVHCSCSSLLYFLLYVLSIPSACSLLQLHVLQEMGDPITKPGI